MLFKCSNTIIIIYSTISKMFLTDEFNDYITIKHSDIIYLIQQIIIQSFNKTEINIKREYRLLFYI